MERITFCPACGSETAYGRSTCEMCGAPLKKQGVEWRSYLRRIPRPSPLGILVALAVVALAIAVFTALSG